jgi:hypothetical protein
MVNAPLFHRKKTAKTRDLIAIDRPQGRAQSLSAPRNLGATRSWLIVDE